MFATRMCSRFWLPREHTAAGLNALDHTFADVRWQKQDFVAGDDDAPFVARHRPQDFANRAFKAAAVGTSHDGRQASGTEHSAGETLRDIDVPLWSVAVGGVPCGRDDRAAAAEPSLARESLAAGELIVRACPRPLRLPSAEQGCRGAWSSRGSCENRRGLCVCFAWEFFAGQEFKLSR